MKRGLLILVIGLVAAGAAYRCVYFGCTASARTMQTSERPELAWLRDEFHLSDAEFKRVSELHAAYMPQCQEMCHKIDAHNAELQKLARDLEGIDLQRVKVRSPLPLLKMSLGARLQLTCAHGRRHLYQARQVREDRKFPAA